MDNNEENIGQMQFFFINNKMMQWINPWDQMLSF